MEDASGEVVYPTLEQICQVNRRMIDEFGGSFIPPYNVRNLESLLYILDAIGNPVFGHSIYPSLKEKAAALAFHIISRHVFYDGNKRTAVHTAWEFLRANRIKLQLDLTIVELTVEIAQNISPNSKLLEWLHGHQS